MHGRQRTDIANTSISLQKTNVQSAREQYVVLKLVGVEHLSVNPANPWLEEPTRTCLRTRQPFAANSKLCLANDVHNGTVLSPQFEGEPSLVRSGRRLCGTATTCPPFPRDKARPIVKLVRVLAIILLKCYPRIVSAMNVVLLSQLGSALQHGV